MALTRLLGCAITLWCAVLVSSRAPAASLVSLSELGHEAADDGKYLIDNAQLDLEDIVTSPLHIADADSPFRSGKFYLGLAVAGGIWGGSYALDQTVRSHLHDMSPSDANLLQTIGYAGVCSSTALLYGYGLAVNDVDARRDMLTAGMAAGVATVTNIGIKAAFGRLRPRQDDHSHTAWFRGGESFTSGDVTPLFALAAGISEYYENKWYVAVPIYSLAMTDGFGRIGHDAHWLSDVVGAALLGWGTTELFLHLHALHAQQPQRWRIFPLSEAGESTLDGARHVMVAGIGVEYEW
jgi:membrane-associated phospholipid phosphatase